MRKTYLVKCAFGLRECRFARVKGYRSDKNAEDADTIEAVRVIFEG